MLRHSPQRTREHIIADLSVNHLERFALRRGHTLQRTQADYGYDATVTTYSPEGEPETGQVFFQFKATESLRLLQDGETIALTVARKHIGMWLREIMPVILVVYDALSETAYWLYVQPYLQSNKERLRHEQVSITLRLSLKSVINDKAIDQIRDLKEAVLNRITGENLHG